MNEQTGERVWRSEEARAKESRARARSGLGGKAVDYTNVAGNVLADRGGHVSGDAADGLRLGCRRLRVRSGGLGIRVPAVPESRQRRGSIEKEAGQREGGGVCLAAAWVRERAERGRSRLAGRTFRCTHGWLAALPLMSTANSSLSACRASCTAGRRERRECGR